MLHNFIVSCKIYIGGIIVLGAADVQVISVTNQKGGVGKTTTAAALAGGLIEIGFRVLVVDLDAQCSLSYIYGASAEYVTVADVIRGNAASADAVQSTEQGDIIAASEELAAEGFIEKKGRYQFLLADALSSFADKYDYVIIDTPPALGMLTINALTASTGVVITAHADVLSLQGIGQLRNTIEAVKEKLNSGLSVLGILITRYSPRVNVNKLSLEMLDDAASDMNTRVFDTKIRESAAVREAQLMQRSLYAHAPRSNAASDYRAFSAEIGKGQGKEIKKHGSVRKGR